MVVVRTVICSYRPVIVMLSFEFDIIYIILIYASCTFHGPSAVIGSISTQGKYDMYFGFISRTSRIKLSCIH
ncbi:hypothetical protein AKJ16_DCAP07498 [Drosera capensis]